MQDFVEDLHNKSMRYVVIVDPGIKVEKGYEAYDRGVRDDIFVKDVHGQPYLGQACISPKGNRTQVIIAGK